MTRLHLAVVAALAVGLAGCGGSGGGTSGGSDLTSVAQARLVVQMDLNGDDAPDILTLDTSKTPFRIVAALQGTLGGDPVDMTPLLAGQTIDSEISRALAEHLGSSFGVGTRTELDVQDATGKLVTVVVFE